MTQDPLSKRFGFGNDSAADRLSGYRWQIRCFHPCCHLFDERRRALETDFYDLLDPKSSSGRLIYAFARRTIEQFHLIGHFQEAYVINEAYQRTIKAHDRGETIRNLPAWLKTLIYRICYEETRKRQRHVSIEQVPEVEDRTISIEQLIEDFAAYERGLQLVMQDVEDIDRVILSLQVIEDLSWKEIRLILRQEGFGDHSEASLRKRKERLLIRLRKRYHSLKLDDL